MIRKAAFKLTCIAALILVLEQNTFAITATEIPGSAQPAQVGRALAPNQMSSEISPPSVTQQEEKKSPVNLAAQKLKFKLNQIVLDGNSVFSTEYLSELYKTELHKVITIAKLFDIVRSITNFYRNQGYILSRAVLPPQHVKNGVVTIRIIEGFIDKVLVSGHPYGSECIVSAYGREAAKSRPLHIARLERYLLFANDVPGTVVKAVLAPSKSNVGAADMTLVVESKRASAYVSYDNYGTRYIGPQQMTANVVAYSAIASGDSLGLTVTKTPKGGELSYADVNYNMPVGDHGVRLVMGATRVQTHPLYVLTSSQIDGANKNYYITLISPIIRSRSETMNFSIGANYLDSDVTSLDEPLYQDRIRSVNFGWNYDFADKYAGTNFLNANARKGIPHFGYSSNTNPSTATTSRPGGRANYTSINASASRIQNVKGALSVYGTVKGQWADNPLLSAEQFAYGGSQAGRGYDVAEILGDKGLGGSVEVRYDWLPKFMQIQSMQLYGFYDAGVIWNKLDVGGILAKNSISSTGAGVRFFMTKYVNGNVMWAQPLTKQVNAEKLIGDGWRPRVFFSLVASI